MSEEQNKTCVGKDCEKKSGGCGCKGKGNNSSLTEKQQLLMSKIKRTNGRNNSIYKNTNYFM